MVPSLDGRSLALSRRLDRDWAMVGALERIHPSSVQRTNAQWKCTSPQIVRRTNEKHATHFLIRVSLSENGCTN